MSATFGWCHAAIPGYMQDVGERHAAEPSVRDDDRGAVDGIEDLRAVIAA